MKNKITGSILVAFALCVATAIAQTRGAQGTQGSSPTMGQPSTQQQPGTGQPGMAPDQTSPTAQTDQNNANENRNDKGEKSLKGCVQSQDGQYVLETKKGNIALTGQDVSAHVGHEVKVKGNWQNGSSTGESSNSSSGSNAAWSKGTFNVTGLDMVSETCKTKTKGSPGSMGTGAGAGSGSGTGAGTANPPQSTTPPQ